MVTPQIQAFFDAQTASNAEWDKEIQDITGDVTRQAALIKKLQENPGTFSPEDQALVDQLQQSNAATTAKLKALNELTVPEVPPVDPPPARNR